MDREDRRRLDREVLSLAVPAFATLVAEPLLVIADSAIIGHVSTASLAGLGVAASVVSLVLGLCIFLAYGTTATVARRLGADDLAGALAGGLDGISLALVVGTVLAIGVGTLAGPIVGLYGVDPAVAAEGARYLSVAAIGFPFALTMLAATGVLRGLQDTRTPLYVAIVMNVVNIALNVTLVLGLGWGIRGAAIGTVCSQAAAAAVLAGLVLRGARRNGVRWHWRPAGVLHAARTGGWLVLRTAGLQAALLAATAAAARMGTVSTAAHQIVNSLWMLLVMAMDAIAIAAQAIVGRYLGAGDAATVRTLLTRLLTWATGIGAVTGVALWAAHPLYLGLFTPDQAVRSLVAQVLPILALVTLIAATVFVLDGVLIGAGDVRYLALASLVNLVVYLPLVALVVSTGAGLVWLWLAYVGLTLSRLVTLGVRARGDAWLRLGAEV
ncbi:MATE family efflux transporter [Propionicicella superfundia]|uniref:MATE family efflux transporter n=1 Tax=Propionicicella superfundia TaxID=348582 RepID=UPI0004026B7C|nr:MATE family efflux transporter [Propionicicella superfundia]